MWLVSAIIGIPVTILCIAAVSWLVLGPCILVAKVFGKK